MTDVPLDSNYKPNYYATTSGTLQNASSTAVTGSAFNVSGMATVVFTIVPTTYTGTVTFKASTDGVNYVSMLATKLGTTTVATNSALNNSSTVEMWVANVAGFSYVEAVTSSVSGGTVTVTATADLLNNAIPVGSTIGTAVIQANSGTALAADQSNSELRVSTYVKSSAAGDTALALGSANKAGSLPVTIATDDSRASGDGLTAANVLVANDGTFNGTTVDRFRGNIDTGALITATGATTTQTGADQTNYNGRGVIVVLDMTNAGTGSVTLEIDGKDSASGKYFALLTGAAVASNSTNVYTVYPGNAVSANVSASTVLPRTWRVKVTANNANATTYTVGANVIL